MIDFRYLQLGVTALGRAHRAGTMAGHLGAAVVAGYFIGEDLPDLPDRVERGIEGELDRVMAGEEAIWFNAKAAGVTPAELFEAFPEESPSPSMLGAIVKSLRKTVGATRQSGHNVIFASIALRALRDHEELATATVIRGVCQLTDAFANAHAGRGYFGKDRGWLNGSQVDPSPESDFPAYDSIPTMARVTIDELIATGAIHKQGFGGLWHVINHAAAIVELDRYGAGETALAALPAHHHHVRLWRMLPDVSDELGPLAKAEHDPREAVYWNGMLKREQARLTHRIKTIYGYHLLRGLVDEDRQRRGDDAFRYLMA